MKDAILRESITKLYETLGEEIKTIKVERVVFGLFFTGVKLSNEQGGLSYTPIKSLGDAVCCPSSAAAMPNAGRMQGESVEYFLDNMFQKDSPLKKTLGIAVINALATTCWKQEKQDKNFALETNKDPIDKINIEEGSHTVIVGALVPYIKDLIKNNRSLSILELDPSTLKGKELDYYIPPNRAHEVVPKADYMIITGVTLINDTLEGLLKMTKPEAKVIVVGPTVSMMPNALFDRNADYVGGVEVTDPDNLLDIIGEGGSGYHFFGKQANKVVVSKK